MVKEPRPYTQWSASPSSPEEIGISTGITAAKRELNILHRELAEQGFNQASGEEGREGEGGREREREREREKEREREREREYSHSILD